MRLLQLSYFKAVCEYGSTVKASEVLSVSQPTISLAIKELEEEFGVILFFRDKKRLTLTKYGETLFRLSINLLNDAQNVSNIMKDMAGKRNSIRLGITPMLASQLLPHIINDYNDGQEKIHFVITEGSQGQLFDLLERNEEDIIISSYDENATKKYNYMTLADMEFWFCISENNPLVNKSFVTIEDIKNINYVVFENQPQSSIKKFFSIYGLEPNIIYKSTQLSTILNLLEKNSVGAFLYPKIITSQYKTLTAIPTEPRIKKNIAAFWKKNNYVFSETKHLLSTVKKFGQNYI